MNNHDDHADTTVLGGPDEASARRLKKFVVAGAAAVMLGLGGAGTAYAVGGGSDTTETGYATVVDAPAESAPDTQVGSPSVSREDCPDKDGGAGTTPESDAAPEAPTVTPDAAPDTSTL